MLCYGCSEEPFHGIMCRQPALSLCADSPISRQQSLRFLVLIGFETSGNRRGNPRISPDLKPAIHFTDKLHILEREKEKAIKIYGNQPNGLWWLEFRLD
ncbi:hypothetical protein AVEN_88517-1 [Araneus ventricosus]|uniref:Uncharacterized protein n=1 Tax=Araneus ventricosus TaxID=182803 RepID=A0A4Y2E798_ARAVE|nr:hypothetical protein AVEN_88517-1 [Araneus ventricosus]